jgi:hypothetical protein
MEIKVNSLNISFKLVSRQWRRQSPLFGGAGKFEATDLLLISIASIVKQPHSK